MIGIICSVHSSGWSSSTSTTPSRTESGTFIPIRPRITPAFLPIRSWLTCAGPPRARACSVKISLLELRQLRARSTTTAPARRHRPHQLVGDARHDQHFLLVGADDVVVGRGAEDDVAAGLVDVGRLVDDDRRVARARRRSPACRSPSRPSRPRRRRSRRPAGSRGAASVSCADSIVGCRQAGDDVRRPARRHDRLVQQRDGLDRARLAPTGGR